jgi:flagellar hook-length control protein FliK
MDAIALLMFVEPAVMPSPRSETPLADVPFGVLVAAAANSKEQDVDDSTDGLSEMAAPQAGLMAAIVSQWLAERDSAPSLPTFARGILEEHGSVVSEAAVSADTAEEPALPLEGLPPTEVSEQAPEMVEQAVATAGVNGATPNHDPMASDSASPDEGSIPVAPRAQMEEPSAPMQQLMQHAADIGRSIPNSEKRLASAELKTSAPSEPVEDTVAKLQAPTPDTHAKATIGQQAVKPPVDDPVTSATVSEVPIRDEAKESNRAELKATAAAAADRANIVKQPVAPHASTHTLESLQSPPNLPSNTANTPSPATDNISIPPQSNISAVEVSADMPVKLAAVTREGQTAEMQTLALHIAARWARGESRFTMRLDPPELGRIDVNLNVNTHGHAQAVLAVEKPQTLELLLRDAPTLERALKDAGLELGGNLSFSLKEEGRQNYAHGDQYSPPSRTIELVQTEAAKPHVALNASLVEQLYGSRTARLDITV